MAKLIVRQLEAEIMDARSLAFNLTPDRTEEDASSDLCEQIDLLGKRYAAQVARLSAQVADTDKALEICNEQLDDAQNRFSASAKLSAKLSAQVVELQKKLASATYSPSSFDGYENPI